MAGHGGSRPGAGRPKGSTKPKVQKEQQQIDADVEACADMTPLDYMLCVMRNSNAHPDRRDRMAIAAAPYAHAKMSDTLKSKGKKEQQAEAAATAGRDSGWSDLLTPGRAN